MPKRKILKSLLPPDAEEKALSAIREALKHPRVLSAEEEREFLSRRHVIERHEYIVTERRGKLVYREHGKGGADLVVPPFYQQMLKRRRDFEAEATKALRRPPLRKPSKYDRVRQVAASIPEGRGRIKAIAREAQCSVDTVRRALKSAAAGK